MSKDSIVIFSMWDTDYPAPMAHRLDKIIRSMQDAEMDVVLVSYFKTNLKKKNSFHHYSLQSALPFLGKLVSVRTNSVNEQTLSEKDKEKQPFFAKLISAVSRSIVAPDINIIIALPSSILLMWAIVKHKPKYVYSLMNPASFTIIGSLTGWLFRKKVFTDFGDLWYVIKEPRLNFKFEKKWHQWLERSTVQRSELVTYAYPEMADVFVKQYPELIYKMRPLEGGYDGNFVKLDNVKKRDSEVLKIGYFGSLRMTEQYVTFLPFIESLSTLFKENSELRNKLKLVIAGNLSQEYRDKIVQLELSDICEYLGYLNSGELEKKMEECDAFVVVTGAREIPFSYLVPQKLYMYMPYKKPVIYIGCEGKQTVRLKKIFPPLFSFSPEQKEDIKNFLISLINDDIDAEADDKVLATMDFRYQFKKAFQGYFPEI
jgi:hypothetical protein